MRIACIYLVLGICLMILGSCNKGYKVRVANYYLENLDSVIIGNRAVIFTGIETGTRTEHRQITSGEHTVKCMVANGEYFYGVASLAEDGGGNHTIQIDGLRQVTVFRD